MSTRQIIILIISIPVMLTVILAALFMVYKYDRTMLGFPPEISPEDTVVQMIEIPDYRLKEMETAMIEKEKLSRQRDSILKEKKRLLDSMMSITDILNTSGDTLSKVHDLLNETKSAAQKWKDSIRKIQRELKNTYARVNLAEERIKSQQKMMEFRKDSLADANFSQFAKIYENSDPKEVARILEQIDEKDAAEILKKMNKRKAGKVIDAMLPESAAAILKLGSRR